jgi:hypothetical protein
MYIELHAASAFSFLRGASLPETLVERAAALGYPALALLDQDGVYGAPRFHKAARSAGIRPLIGAELTIETRRESGGGISRELENHPIDHQIDRPIDHPIDHQITRSSDLEIRSPDHHITRSPDSRSLFSSPLNKAGTISAASSRR